MTKKKMPGELVGEVTHFFPNVNAGVIKVKRVLKIGDELLFQGSTSRFKQKIKSMQINRKPIERAKKGDEVGLLTKKRVRAGDLVYRIGKGL